MGEPSTTEARANTLRSVLKRMGSLLLCGPGGITLVGFLSNQYEITTLLKTVVLKFEKLSHAFWGLLLDFLPFHLPLDRDLMTFAVLLALPLAFRRFILRKTSPPHEYDSVATFSLIMSISSLCVTLLFVTLTLSGGNIQAGVYFYLGLGCYVASLVSGYLHVKAITARHHDSSLTFWLGLVTAVLGNAGALVLFSSQMDLQAASARQLALFWPSTLIYLTAGLFMPRFLAPRGLRVLQRGFTVLTLVTFPLIYVGGISAADLAGMNYAWAFANGILCACLVAFIFRHLQVLPEAPINILLVAVSIVFADWFSRTVAPIVGEWIKHNT